MDADTLIMYIASARKCATRHRTTYHLIKDGEKLRLVEHIAPSDVVVVRDIKGPRATQKLISTECESKREIDLAMPYLRRAAEIIRMKHSIELEVEELGADLIEHMFNLESFQDIKNGIFANPKKRGLFARIFGRVPY
jgi:hypothetical protein